MTTGAIIPGTATIILDGSGNGTVKIGPVTARERWLPANASVSVSQSITNEAQCRIYAGDQPIPVNFIDATLSGSTGDATGRVNGITLKLGQYIWAVWSGGDPGHVATLNVTGSKEI